jgi:glutathione S-transferase
MITIYGASFSPFVRKTLVVAREKGIQIKVQPVGGNLPKPAEFLAASPFGKIPAMVDGDFAISDSSAIVAYFEAIAPEPNLIPTEPKARARTIWYEEFGDTILTSCGAKIVFNRVVAPKFLGRAGDDAVADEAERTELPKMLDYLEGVIPASGFLVEDRFTLADIAVATSFATLAYANCPIDAAKYPKLVGYLEGVLARPSFADLIAREKAFLGAA